MVATIYIEEIWMLPSYSHSLVSKPKFKAHQNLLNQIQHFAALSFYFVFANFLRLIPIVTNGKAFHTIYVKDKRLQNQ